jgi:hypothetical protein
MNLDQYFLLLTHAYLRAPKASLPGIEACLKASSYDFENPRALQKYSLAGLDSSGQEIGFFTWANQLRQESVLRLAVCKTNTGPGQLEERIAASFLGGVIEALMVETKQGQYFFALTPLTSPSHQAGPQDLIALVAAQDDPEPLRRRMLELVQEHMELNHIPFFPQAPYESLLNLPGIWESRAENLLQELQVEVQALGKKFHVPQASAGLLEQFHKLDSLPTASGSFVFFYNEGQVTPAQLAELIEAQTSLPGLREQAQAALKESGLEVNLTQKDWQSALANFAGETWEQAVSVVSRVIADACTEKRAEPVVPLAQKGLWGPNPMEKLRIQARHDFYNQGFYWTENPNSWALYLFTPVRLAAAFKPAPEDFPACQSNYLQSLQAIADFAEEIGSPFSQAFRLAILPLESDFPKADLETDEAKNAFTAWAAAAGLSEKAQEILVSHLNLIATFATLLFTPLQVRALLSFDVSSVFGGMGSWNDQGFENAEQEKRNTQVSNALYDSRQKLFEALMQYTASV